MSCFQCNTIAVASPNDMTKKMVAYLLNAHYRKTQNEEHYKSCKRHHDIHFGDDIQVASFRWQPLGRGVLSNVQLLTVCYITRSDSTPNIPTQFLAKFRKEEIPLENLFSVEGNFYRLAREFAIIDDSFKCESASNVTSFPFRLVDAIAAGRNWLLLEYIPSENVDIIDVHESCPEDRFDDVLIRLARMHAACWIGPATATGSETTATNSSSADATTSMSSMVKKLAHELSPTPGAGHSLPSSERQGKFHESWPGVRERLIPHFDSTAGLQSLQRLDEIVSWTAQCPRIESTARSVAERKYTLVHGDFHIGNMLLPKVQSNSGEDGEMRKRNVAAPWLVDWSMAGVGNPCVDLVFFLVVGDRGIPTYEITTSAEDSDSCLSTNASATEHVEAILKRYYQGLTSEENAKDKVGEESARPSSNIASPTPMVPWETFLTMFSQCLLNQFVILVCYDGLCRNMADASPESQIYHDHFDRVNARCARMLLSEYGTIRLMGNP